MHDVSWFITLTYNDQNLPEGNELVPDDLQRFFKRLRAAVPEKIRYYACGEYGDDKGRAHYHAVVFGLRDPTVVERVWRTRSGDPLGHVYVGTVTTASAAYVAGYVIKKMTRSDRRWHGKRPEFTRMSLRPAIGKTAALELARNMNTSQGAAELAQGAEISTVRLNGKVYSLGRYLKSVIRAELGGSAPVKSLIWPEWATQRELFYQRLTERLTSDGRLELLEARKQQRAAKAAFRHKLRDQSRGKVLSL